MKAYRAALFHMLDDPARVGFRAHEYFEDGGLLVDGGRIVEAGSWSAIAPKLPPGAALETFSDALIVPGLIDAHVHYPQLDIVGSYGGTLLEWLDRYAYPAERKFADRGFAKEQAEFFIEQLLRNGTTSALVFATVHALSADTLFEAAARRNMRLITGKTLMDRNAPADLRDTAQSAYTDSKRLIEKWHGLERLSYAVTPRFAVTSSKQQLAAAERLLNEHAGVFLHTHLSENHAEIAEVSTLFPDVPDYFGVYEKYGLARPRSVFAHAIHLTGDAWGRLAHCGAAAAFCPSSNLFLGSGLFDLAAAEEHSAHVALGTDLGAGTSLSLFAVMRDAYYVCQARGRALDPFKSFYLATLGAARALQLDSHIGNFEPGKEADFLILDLKAKPLLEQRMRTCSDAKSRLFALSILGDDRIVSRTYVNGALAHRR